MRYKVQVECSSHPKQLISDYLCGLGLGKYSGEILKKMKQQYVGGASTSIISPKGLKRCSGMLGLQKYFFHIFCLTLVPPLGGFKIATFAL